MGDVLIGLAVVAVALVTLIVTSERMFPMTTETPEQQDAARGEG
jgi:hypothetical protein